MVTEEGYTAVTVSVSTSQGRLLKIPRGGGLSKRKKETMKIHVS